MYNKSVIFVTIATLVIISTSIFRATANEVITIDPSQIIKIQKQPLIGENLNFLMSSDKKWPRKVSMKSRIKEMNLGMLRFPYGHLADNYLFTDAPFNDGIKGLTPRVASTNIAPGPHKRAVDDNGANEDCHHHSAPQEEPTPEWRGFFGLGMGLLGAHGCLAFHMIVLINEDSS